jgi:hypothetical protein
MMGLLNFHSRYENIIWPHLKHFSFWLSVDVKLILDDLVHAMTWQCVFALSLQVYYNLYASNMFQNKAVMMSFLGTGQNNLQKVA